MFTGETWIQTHCGSAFYPNDPQPAGVLIEDIAHSLSMQCRYAGHCKRFYSVAEHSLLLSRVVSPSFALTALLHDATEAYVQDMIRPIKDLFPQYRIMEGRIWLAVAGRFGLSPVIPPEVKIADKRMLVTEVKHLFTNPAGKWREDQVLMEPFSLAAFAPLAQEGLGLAPDKSKELFLARFKELGGRELSAEQEMRPALAVGAD